MGKLCNPTTGKKEDAASAAGGARSNERAECQLCFEVYNSDEPGLHVPRILTCGHTACQGCFARMLARIDEKQNGEKLFSCPVCNVVTEVSGGEAASLPKNFSLLR